MASNQTDALQTVLDFEQKLDVEFTNKSLLVRTLTHRSYINESALALADNERLEFLGDAIIDAIVAEMLFQRFPEQREGPLTAMRAALVRRETLAQFARHINLGEYLLMGKGEIESGGRERDGILCNAFEALCGAIYLDRGIDATRSFLLSFIEPELVRLRSGNVRKDPKSLLQEWAQGQLNETPRYVTVDSQGPDHAKEFTVEVRIGGVAYGTGRGKSKQNAAQSAAYAAYKHLAAATDDLDITEEWLTEHHEP